MVSKFSFCFMILLFVICVDESHSLKEGDVGACRGRVSSIATKRVPKYWTQYCRGTRNICRMRKWKIEPYVKWTMGTICCEGWQHDGEMDACKPICSTGCLNGTCVAPQQCQCNPPMYLDPSRRNTCLSPVCDAPCINSECINKQIHNYEHETTPSQPLQNGICECFNNTRRYNETHCAFCDENYKINSDLSCNPQCRTPCVNGECIAPNKCRCLEGYKYKDDFSCESYCHQCVNGKCIGPNKCQCLPGFLAVNDTHCEQCGCENGDCVSGLRICRDGYTLIDGVCEPVCSQPCVNGVCSAPGECKCFEEHNKSADPLVCCRPECGNVCDGNGECPLVACVPRKTIKIPNCTPNPPRKRCIKVKTQLQMMCCNHWKYIVKEDKCEPICKSGCVNGDCVAPDTCACLPGFVEHNETTCIPHCEIPCSKGVCSAPNECTCDPNYQHHPTDKFTCLPICETQCVNASCISPNTCSCDPGYEHENNWQCKPVCHTCQNGECIGPNNCRCNRGYAMKDDQCTPVCDKPCLNGHCSMPNECSCHDGFKRNPLNKFSCEPICEPECVNSECTSPNTCSCYEGYEIENDRRCKPVCDSCENGICIGPNNCSCVEGYEMQDGRCKPICEPKCENATCVSPNTCTCNHGYTADSKWKCRPVCDSCEHGICIAPGTCSCNVGYEIQDGRCTPVCKTPCVNGRCVKPNECECFKNFELNKITSKCDPICEPGCVKSKCVAPNECLCLDGYEETSKPFLCKPICDSCENGVCVAPDRCNCNEGYKMTDQKCSPICSEECEHGYCSSPNVCTCIDGFVKKEGKENICYKACDSPCENGYCNDYGICECHTGFEMHNHTCHPSVQVDCDSCESNCTRDGDCRCNNGELCYVSLKPYSEEITTSASLAGLEWSWMLGGAVGVLLIALLLVVIQRTWAHRQLNSEKPTDERNDMYSSVVYQTVVPNTLINSNIPEDGEAQDDYYDEVTQEPLTEVQEVQDSLLGTRVDIEDEHL